MSRLDKYKRLGKGKEVNLIPFMNLLAILIPVLLVSTQYIKIATIAVSSPPFNPDRRIIEKTPDPPPLNLSVMIGSLGFYIASSETVFPEGRGNPEDGQARRGPTIPKIEVDEKLRKIKKAFEREKQVTVAADPDVAFTSVVRVMDAARNYIDDKGEKRSLFPQIVLSAGVV